MQVYFVSFVTGDRQVFGNGEFSINARIDGIDQIRELEQCILDVAPEYSTITILNYVFLRTERA